MTLDAAQLRELAAARAIPSAPERVAALRTAGEAVAERLRESAGVDGFEPLDLGTIALESAAVLPAWRAPLRLVPLRRRAWLVRAGGLKVLVDPTTEDGFARTPFGERLVQRHPLRMRSIGLRPLDRVLGDVGLHMEDIDLVLLTHLRFVSIERLLQTFPRARVVVSEREWSLAQAPPAWERPFRDRQVPSRSERIVRAPGDVALAAGLVFVMTPGLTEGSASVVCHVGRRLRVASPHGLTRDAWTPYESTLAGVRETVRLRDVEVVPRGDAASASMATESMILERSLSDRDGPWHTIDPWAELLPATAFLGR